MREYSLPVNYNKLTPRQRREVREQYEREQGGCCMWCGERLDAPPPAHILTKRINDHQFPPKFLKCPVHLQHDHDTGLTEGAVHSKCNAVMWQYHSR